jgi:hypothetical protein
MSAEKLNKKLRKTVKKYNRLLEECNGMPGTGTELETELKYLAGKVKSYRDEINALNTMNQLGDAVDSLVSSLVKDDCQCLSCIKRRSLESEGTSEPALEKSFEKVLKGLISSIGAELQTIAIAEVGSNIIVWDTTESEFTAPIEVVLDNLRKQYPGKEVLVKH